MKRIAEKCIEYSVKNKEHFVSLVKTNDPIFDKCLAEEYNKTKKHESKKK